MRRRYEVEFDGLRQAVVLAGRDAALS